MKKIGLKFEKNAVAQILAFTTVFFWSVSIVFTKIGTKYYDSKTLAVLRYVFTFFMLIVVIIINKIKK